MVSSILALGSNPALPDPIQASRATSSMMQTLHKAIFAGQIVLGVAWGLLLNVAGWYVLALRAGSADDQRLQLWVGVLALSAGNFVFMAIVAGRVIQPPKRGAMDMLEFATGGLMLVAAVMSATLLFRGGGL